MYNSMINSPTVMSTHDGEGGARTQREMIESKLEAKRLAEEQNYTFKPKIKLYKTGTSDNGGGEYHGSSNNGGSNRFEKLYSDARKRRSSTNGSKTGEDQCTFAPKITSRASSRGRSQSPASERLYSSARGRQENNQEITAEPSPYPFQPKITKRASSAERSQKPITDRLYEQTAALKEKKERAKMESDQRVKDECTFTPKMNPASRSISAGRRQGGGGSESPQEIVNRLQQYEREKKARLEEMRRIKREQEEAEATFRPKLSTASTSSLLAQAVTPTSDRPTNVYERLSSSGLRDDRSELTIETELTFRPNIPERSRAMTPSRMQSDGNLHERLYREAEEKRLEKEFLRQQEEEEEEQQRRSLKRTSSAGNLTGSSAMSVVERLSSVSEKKMMQTLLNQMKDEMELKECTFTPKNYASLPVEPKSDLPVHLRLLQEAERAKEDAEKRKQELEQEFAKEATFRPNISSASRKLERKRSEGAIHERLNAQAEKTKAEIARKQKLKEEEEFRAATFRPELTSSGKLLEKTKYDEVPVFDRMTRAVEKQREKELKRKEQKLQNELKDATFSPAVLNSYVSKRRVSGENVSDLSAGLMTPGFPMGDQEYGFKETVSTAASSTSRPQSAQRSSIRNNTPTASSSSRQLKPTLSSNSLSASKRSPSPLDVAGSASKGSQSNHNRPKTNQIIETDLHPKAVHLSDFGPITPKSQDEAPTTAAPSIRTAIPSEDDAMDEFHDMAEEEIVHEGFDDFNSAMEAILSETMQSSHIGEGVPNDAPQQQIPIAQKQQHQQPQQPRSPEKGSIKTVPRPSLQPPTRLSSGNAAVTARKNVPRSQSATLSRKSTGASTTTNSSTVSRGADPKPKNSSAEGKSLSSRPNNSATVNRARPAPQTNPVVVAGPVVVQPKLSPTNRPTAPSDEQVAFSPQKMKDYSTAAGFTPGTGKNSHRAPISNSVEDAKGSVVDVAGVSTGSMSALLATALAEVIPQRASISSNVAATGTKPTTNPAPILNSLAPSQAGPENEKDVHNFWKWLETQPKASTAAASFPIAPTMIPQPSPRSSSKTIQSSTASFNSSQNGADRFTAKAAATGAADHSAAPTEKILRGRKKAVEGDVTNAVQSSSSDQTHSPPRERPLTSFTGDVILSSPAPPPPLMGSVSRNDNSSSSVTTSNKNSGANVVDSALLPTPPAAKVLRGQRKAAANPFQSPPLDASTSIPNAK